jgi:hypothetical protein
MHFCGNSINHPTDTASLFFGSSAGDPMHLYWHQVHSSWVCGACSGSLTPAVRYTSRERRIGGTRGTGSLHPNDGSEAELERGRLEVILGTAVGGFARYGLECRQTGDEGFRLSSRNSCKSAFIENLGHVS